MPLLPDLRDVPTSALTERLCDIRNGEQLSLVEFLAYLAELDSRRDFLDLGFPSCFAFLRDHLGYTKSSAFRRTTAARLLSRFPTVADYLADGRLCLTTLVELRDVLSEERLDEVLGRAAGRTEDQVKELVAALRPRPAPPDLLRRLPEPRPQPVDSAGPELSTAPVAHEELRPRVEPISEELRVLRITVGRDFVADLEAVRSALSHVIVDGNMAKVIHECLRRTRHALERAQVGACDRPRPAPEKLPEGRRIPAAVRREVRRRDEGQCTFVGSDGHRCGSTYQVQFHHEMAYSKDGEATVDNVRQLCRIHNQHLAEKEFGAEHIALARALAESDRQMSLL